MEITLYSWELLKLEGKYFVKRINAYLPSDPQSWVVYSLDSLTTMSTVFALDKYFARAIASLTLDEQKLVIFLFNKCFSLDIDYDNHRVNAKIKINVQCDSTKERLVRLFKNHLCVPIVMSLRKRNIGPYVTRTIEGPPTWDIHYVFPKNTRMWGYNLI